MTSSTRAPVRPVHASSVLEREREIRIIDDALEKARTGIGTAVLFEGDAGIGKSTLVRLAARNAAEHGMLVLRAVGGELERAVPYGVVAELFGRLARDERRSEDLFRGPAAFAARLLGFRPALDRDGGDASEWADPVANLHGLFWLVLNIVEREPLTLVVDDAQWADEPSLRFLHSLVQRIDDVPLIVLLAMRPEGDSPASDAGRLLRTHRGITHVVPEALSEGAVGQLMSSVAGRSIDDDLRTVSWRVTRGNPFFVTALGSELARIDRDVDDVEQIESFVPDRVGRFIAARLSGADPSARQLAEAVAVLGDSATFSRAVTLGRIDPDVAADAARWLVEAGVLDGTTSISFLHPIVRSGVYASIPAPTRGLLHRRAALLLADDGADIAVVGGQLCEAEPFGDPRVVELLTAAATDALASGEPEFAVRLLRRAIAEPPPPSNRPDLLAMVARAEAAAGSPSARERFDAALQVTADPGRRAALLLGFGHALTSSGQWAAGRDQFKRGLAEASDSDRTLQAQLEAGYLGAAWITMEDRDAINERVERILSSAELGPANRELAVWIAFQQGAVVGSTAPDMANLVKRAFAEAPVEVLAREGQAVEVGCGLLLETDDLEFELDFLSRALEAARTTGPIGKAGIYAYCRAWPNYYMGRLTDAIADAEESLRAADLGWETFVPAAATVTALAHIERNELDAAEAAITLDTKRWDGRIDTAMLVPLALGRLALARGDTATSIDHFRTAGEGAGSIFMRNGIPTEWRSWYAISLLRAGRRDDAREIVTEAVDIARAWDAAWPLGAALRVAGIVEGGTAGVRVLRDAEALLKSGPARLEHARVLVDLGMALRRMGVLTEARDVLARAADLAHQLGATALLGRAGRELRAAGARPRRLALTGVAALTPGELRVVQEAIAGRSNREIAQALFVTPKAVEFHLANAYRKLEIGSRTELAATMAANGPGH